MRHRLAALGIALFSSLTLDASPARAQSITSADLSSFLDTSAKYAREPLDVGKVLYDIAAKKLTPGETIDAFARELGVARATAEAYAAAIVETALLEQVCPSDERRCGFVPGRQSYELAAKAGALDPSGRVLAVVGRHLRYGGALHDEQAAAFTRLVLAHPSAASVFRAMLDDTKAPFYLLAFIASTPNIGDAEMSAAVSALFDISLGYGTGDNSGWFEAILEATERSIRGASPAARAVLAQHATLWRLQSGLNAEALAAYDAYPRAVQRLLPVSTAGCSGNASLCRERQRTAYRLADELGSAMWLAGRKPDALRLLQRQLPGLGTRDGSAERRFKALEESIQPTRSNADLFSVFIEGEPVAKSESPSLIDADTLEILETGRGWLFTVKRSSRSLRQVVAARLRSAAYPEMAAYLDEPDVYGRSDYEAAFATLASRFPNGVHERRAYWQRRLRSASTPATPPQGERASYISTRDLPVWWTEKSLPPSVSAWREEDTAPRPPDDVDLPVHPESVLRYERQGREHLIIYASTDYDLPGEIPAFGLWFARTVGERWSRPLYLGLQQHYPYVVTPGSRLPLLNGNRLQVEVRVKEIDSATITFPPIGLRVKRSANGLYLDIDLDRLQSDRDGDGLTDIEERRLGLDYSNADTDGDGLPDGVDPLPLTPYIAAASRLRSAVAAAILSATVGHDAQAIMVAPEQKLSDLDARALMPSNDKWRTAIRTQFLVADPTLFSGIAPRFRLLVYSKQDVDTLRQGAPFFPPRVEYLFSSLDGMKHFVLWSASWTGGRFLVTCASADGPCEVTVISNWIS